MGVFSFSLLLSSSVSRRKRAEVAAAIRRAAQVMMDPVRRFSNRAENYAKYRPGYPAELIAILKSECGLTETSSVADVGSGTGILSELFLRNGNKVFAIEPNARMRLFAERDLKFPKFVSIEATAEATTLEPVSVHL